MSSPTDPQTLKGFLTVAEGEMLAHYAKSGAEIGAVVEIGAWCGRSSLYLAQAIQQSGQLLFSVDHHRGSEENQPEWEWFDPEVWDQQAKMIDTLPHFRNNIRKAGMEKHVVAMVGPSAQIGEAWASPLGFLFLDGGHTMQAALADYRAWARHLLKGGFLAIHDVFPNPADGGRAPFEVCQMAERSGFYARCDQTGSLVVLQRL
ncbi:putative secreted protein [hydrothermal vent metagenome]|uniref:Putative secreted protein n=1 Tax=hydrothermal vent metagenome TaxID=652676 RepID=A0A3B0RXA8_9ZZZZ